MASNHTEHFSLNQWLPDDQVKRTDFNEDNAKLDAALNDLSGGLAEKADQTALDALAAEVAKRLPQRRWRPSGRRCRSWWSGLTPGMGPVDNPTRAPWISQPRWAVPQSLLWSGQKTATTAVSF